MPPSRRWSSPWRCADTDTDDGGRSTSSFGLNDLPYPAMLASRAHQAVEELTPPASANEAPPFSPVAQLSGSAFCGKRTTPTFCRSFYRFPDTPSSSKALVPVALRAGHPLPRSPRFRGERGWERPPSILRMDGPERGGFCRPFCRLRGRSQPAPPARVIPAGRQLRDDESTRAPAFVEHLQDPARAPHHPPHRGPRRVPVPHTGTTERLPRFLPLPPPARDCRPILDVLSEVMSAVGDHV